MNAIRNLSQRRRGRTLVEFAVVAPVVFMLLFGSLEWCRYIMTRNQAENAAREAARFAICRTDTTQTNVTNTDVTNVVLSYLSPIGNSLTNVQASVYKVNRAGQPIDLNGTVITQAAAVASTNQANWYQSAFGQGICVTVTATYSPLVPGLLQTNATLPMQVTAVMNSEGN